MITRTVGLPSSDVLDTMERLLSDLETVMTSRDGVRLDGIEREIIESLRLVGRSRSVARLRRQRARTVDPFQRLHEALTAELAAQAFQTDPFTFSFVWSRGGGPELEALAALLTRVGCSYRLDSGLFFEVIVPGRVDLRAFRADLRPFGLDLR